MQKCGKLNAKHWQNKYLNGPLPFDISGEQLGVGPPSSLKSSRPGCFKTKYPYLEKNLVWRRTFFVPKHFPHLWSPSPSGNTSGCRRSKTTSPLSRSPSGMLPTIQCQNSDKVLKGIASLWKFQGFCHISNAFRHQVPIPPAVDVEIREDDRVEGPFFRRPPERSKSIFFYAIREREKYSFSSPDHGGEPRDVRRHLHPRERPDRPVGQLEQVGRRGVQHLRDQLVPNENVAQELGVLLVTH